MLSLNCVFSTLLKDGSKRSVSPSTKFSPGAPAGCWLADAVVGMRSATQKSQKSHLHCLRYKKCFTSLTRSRKRRQRLQGWQIWRLGDTIRDTSFSPSSVLPSSPGSFPHGCKVAAGAPHVTASPPTLEEGEQRLCQEPVPEWRQTSLKAPQPPDCLSSLIGQNCVTCCFLNQSVGRNGITMTAVDPSGLPPWD